MSDRGQTFPHDLLRLFLGFLVAPISTCAIYFFVISEGFIPYFILISLTQGTVILFFVYLVMIPTYILLSRKNLISLVNISIVVFLQILIPSLMLSYHRGGRFAGYFRILPEPLAWGDELTLAGMLNVFLSSVVTGLFGLLGAVLFYFIALYDFSNRGPRTLSS